MEFKDGRIYHQCGRCKEITAKYEPFKIEGHPQVHGVACDHCYIWRISGSLEIWPGIQNAALNLRYFRI